MEQKNNIINIYRFIDILCCGKKRKNKDNQQKYNFFPKENPVKNLIIRAIENGEKESLRALLRETDINTLNSNILWNFVEKTKKSNLKNKEITNLILHYIISQSKITVGEIMWNNDMKIKKEKNLALINFYLPMLLSLNPTKEIINKVHLLRRVMIMNSLLFGNKLSQKEKCVCINFLKYSKNPYGKFNGANELIKIDMEKNNEPISIKSGILKLYREKDTAFVNALKKNIKYSDISFIF